VSSVDLSTGWKLKGRNWYEAMSVPDRLRIVLNEDGKKTIKEPFTALYYPKRFRQSKSPSVSNWSR
jgi:hypothetical protein